MFSIYKNCKNHFRLFSPTSYHHANKYKHIIKFIIAGSIATLSDFSLLYFLTDVLGIWYLFSSIIASTVGTFVSFCLQKFWTFRNNELKNIYQQVYLYFLIGLINLSINSIAMYLLVSKFKIWYILAQIIISGILSICNFMIYRFIIFKHWASKK
ncbi:MAG: GtrA family protein [Patescibacteria group bacterium]